MISPPTLTRHSHPPLSPPTLTRHSLHPPLSPATLTRHSLHPPASSPADTQPKLVRLRGHALHVREPVLVHLRCVRRLKRRESRQQNGCMAQHLRNAIVAVPGIAVGTGVVLAAEVVKPVVNQPTGDHSTVGADTRAVLPVIIQPHVPDSNAIVREIHKGCRGSAADAQVSQVHETGGGAVATTVVDGPLLDHFVHHILHDVLRNVRIERLPVPPPASQQYSSAAPATCSQLMRRALELVGALRTGGGAHPMGGVNPTPLSTAENVGSRAAVASSRMPMVAIVAQGQLASLAPHTAAARAAAGWRGRRRRRRRRRPLWACRRGPMSRAPGPTALLFSRQRGAMHEPCSCCCKGGDRTIATRFAGRQSCMWVSVSEVCVCAYLIRYVFSAGSSVEFRQI
jgi:hypothetical protein